MHQTARRLRRLALLGVPAVLAGTGAYAAESARASRTAYFYAAPRETARVLDEIRHEAELAVMSCDAGWCEVRYGKASGYVREAVVHGSGNEEGPGRIDRNACVTAQQPGAVSWQSVRFCRRDQQ